MLVEGQGKHLERTLTLLLHAGQVSRVRSDNTNIFGVERRRDCPAQSGHSGKYFNIVRSPVTCNYSVLNQPANSCIFLTNVNYWGRIGHPETGNW